VEGAIDAGLDVVLWFYSQAVTEQEAVEEASFLASAASKYGITSPLVLRSGYSKEFQGRADSLSKEDRTTCIRAGVLTLQNAGYTPMLCAEAEWLDTNLTLSDLGGVLLWLVQYNSEVTYPGAYSVWQYTEKGLVEGIEGYTGLNIKSEN
jgi:hypothetical protein